MVRLRTISSAVLALACACSGSPPSTINDVPPACSRPISASALPAQVLLHESHKTGDMVNFTVPPGTGSVTIVHQAQTANLQVVFKGQVVSNSAVPGILVMPDGGTAYNDNDPAFAPPSSPDGGTDPSGLYSFFGGDSPSTGAFTVPNTTTSLGAGVPAGSWSFQVNDYAYECATQSGCSDGGALGNTYDVTVMAKPTPTGGTRTLDVAFYIVANINTRAGQPLTAANAGSDPSVKRMLSTFTGIYAAANITVGTVAFYDVPAAAVTRFGTNVNADLTGPCDELDQMLLLSSAHPGNTINLFLVQSITSKSTAGGSVVGIDGTIPGPSSLSGTVHSGAAVSLADLFSGTANCIPGGTSLYCGADSVAYIAAHEAGHFLGLFHTTEQDGRDFDPLTDTPKCPCIPCASSTDLPRCTTGGTSSNPIFLTASQCSGPSARPACTGAGGDNLMFWQLSAGVSVGTISPQQAAVMALSPAVH
jgi:hypothetical protein